MIGVTPVAVRCHACVTTLNRPFLSDFLRDIGGAFGRCASCRRSREARPACTSPGASTRGTGASVFRWAPVSRAALGPPLVQLPVLVPPLLRPPPLLPSVLLTPLLQLLL